MLPTAKFFLRRFRYSVDDLDFWFIGPRGIITKYILIVFFGCRRVLFFFLFCHPLVPYYIHSQKVTLAPDFIMRAKSSIFISPQLIHEAHKTHTDVRNVAKGLICFYHFIVLCLTRCLQWIMMRRQYHKFHR